MGQQKKENNLDAVGIGNLTSNLATNFTSRLQTGIMAVDAAQGAALGEDGDGDIARPVGSGERDDSRDR